MSARHAIIASAAASLVLLGSAPARATAGIPAAGHAIRLGGDLAAAAERRGEDWVCGTAAITTPLPVGYPPPTPPGAIDLKTYPSLRRAEVTSRTRQASLGMNLAFFPLFNHIQRRDIAMTSPVEMDYAGMSVGGGAEPAAAATPGFEAMTMSFLYRSPELGPVGLDDQDAKVRVVDTEPATSLSVGLQGGYGLEHVREGVERLQAWLAANPGWQTVGDVRALHYNGPERRDRDKWLEVQVPVAPRGTD